MTAPQDHPFKASLLALRAGLLEQLQAQQQAAAGRTEVSSEHFGHPDEAGAHLASERELDLALGGREKAELAAIDAALARIAAGTYGECTDCASPIAPARLQATPEAPRCISCQEKVERRHTH